MDRFMTYLADPNPKQRREVILLLAIIMKSHQEIVKNEFINRYNLISNILNYIQQEGNAKNLRYVIQLLELTFIKVYKGADSLTQPSVECMDLANINMQTLKTFWD
mmetsp:Transcript_32182/g.31504  ORF Transcript_32182/g.31504 Transcript_32182/m.31504 type:complete len:106 (+) Transcript_32182:940-1257(+)